MYINKSEFETKCTDIMQDVENQKLKSPTWIWITVGAFLGLAASCVRMKRPSGPPLMARYNKTGGDTDGKSKRRDTT